MKIAYCDCFSGISGDMFLGALLDAGLPLETLRGELAKLRLPDSYEINVTATKKGAISASLAEIHTDGQDEHAHSHASEPAPFRGYAHVLPGLRYGFQPGWR